MGEYIAEFGWFFELGAVTIISTIVAILLTNLWKVTILKKSLSTATSNGKDQILGLAGTITSLVVFALVYVANIMRSQWTFNITINWHDAWISIVSGASVTWVAAKGLYTAWHKFIKRLKSGVELKESAKEAKKDINKVKEQVAEVNKNNSSFNRRR